MGLFRREKRIEADKPSSPKDAYFADLDLLRLPQLSGKVLNIQHYIDLIEEGICTD